MRHSSRVPRSVDRFGGSCNFCLTDPFACVAITMKVSDQNDRSLSETGESARRRALNSANEHIRGLTAENKASPRAGSYNRA